MHKFTFKNNFTKNFFHKFRAILNSIIHYESIHYFPSNDSLMNTIGLLLLCQNIFNKRHIFFQILALNTQIIYYYDNCAILNICNNIKLIDNEF